LSTNAQSISSLAFYESVIACHKGEWERARRAVARALDASPDNFSVLFIAACVCLETGDEVRLAPFLIRIRARLTPASPPPDLGTCADWLGCAAWKTGRDDIAVLAIAAAELDATVNGPPQFLSAAWCGRAWVALARRDAAAVTQAFGQLDAYRTSPGMTAGDGGATETLLLAALLEAEAGSPDLAVQRFESSLQVLRHVQHRSRTAWTLAEFAHALQRRGGSDRARAADLLDEALSIARELGMKPLIESILRRRENLRA
jgi:hypothetical protein